MIPSAFLNTERKIRNSWWVVIFFLVLSLLLFPLLFLSDKYHFEVELWHQVIIILTASVLCQKLRRQPPYELIGKMNRTWFIELLAGAMLGALLMIFPVILLTVFGFIHWQANEFSIATLVSGLTLMASVALAEELLFRGFIFQRLIGAFGTWPAQFAIAGLFLLTHLNNPGMTGILKTFASVNIFIASILFGIAYTRTKKLAMPLGLHFMANVMQGTILGFGVSGEHEISLFAPVFDKGPTWVTGGMFGIEASLPGLFSLILITTALYFWHRSKKSSAA